MKRRSICPKCGTAADATVQSRFCLECGADLFVSEAEQEAEEERKRREEESERLAAEEERKRDEAEKRRREKNAQEIKKAKEARERREAEERKRKEAEARKEAETKAKAEEERKRKEASATNTKVSVWEWIGGALLVFVVAYSLFNGIPLLNGVELKDLPADMIDWVAWEAEGITGSVPHKEGPIYRVSKETKYSNGKVHTESAYGYDRRGNMTRKSVEYFKDGVSDGSKSVTEFSDFDKLGCFHAFNSEGGTPQNVTYETSGDLVKKRVHGSGWYVEYEYYQDGKLKTVSSVSTGIDTKREYDENGLVRAQRWDFSTKSDEDSKTFYLWELDSSGNPKGYKSQHGSESEVIDLSSAKMHRVVCDDNGNIVEVYNSEERMELKREYVTIRRPSVFAWTKAHVVDLEDYDE